MKLLMHVVQSYSFEILRPLQAAAQKRGYDVAWFVSPSLRDQLQPGELSLVTLASIQDWEPDAVFVPGNEVPTDFPGIKVQVFHGFGIEKKGHFRIRGMFHLYCTHGELTTREFERLAAKHGNFLVRETGWPKVDPLFETAQEKMAEGGEMRVLYAPTFSPKLTSAVDVLPAVKGLLKKHPWEWRVKFHPKMSTDIIEQWQDIRAANYQVVEGDIMPQLKWADVLVTDTSSVAAEFMLLDKPVVSYRNRQPGEHLLNIQLPSQLGEVLEAIGSGKVSNHSQRRQYAQRMHPFTDGMSSERVLDAVKDLLKSNALAVCKPLPKLWFRQRKMKKALRL